jgi:5-methylcytosine-specific restriction endonuclease McrA
MEKNNPTITNKRKAIPKAIKEIVKNRQGLHCWYCGKRTTAGRARHHDHIVPVEQGGQNTPDNLVISCKACNTRKGKTSYDKYIERRIEQVELELRTLKSRTEKK